MRIFYIFKINKQFLSLTKNCPFNLYKTLEQIYYLNKNDFNLAYQLFENIASPFDKNEISQILFQKYQYNDHYTKFNYIHMFNNYYTDEQTELTINNAHLILKSTIPNPSFFNELKSNSNLFVCDFQNKDYFWLEQIPTYT